MLNMEKWLARKKGGWYKHWRAGIKAAMPLPSRDGDGQRKDEVRPLVSISVLYSVQCFDSNSWVTETTSGP